MEKLCVNSQNKKGSEESLKRFKMETWKMENQKEQRRVKNGNLEDGKSKGAEAS